MKNTDENPLVSIEPLIHLIRNQQVILDSDLAMLYGVETKRLNEQVKRNADRFPEDFMFQLTREEAEQSRSHFATMNTRGSNIKYLPYVFTENGVAMLSDLIRQAQERIVLFDNYIDDTVLTILDKRAEKVKATIYTKHIPRALQLDIARHNAQYPPIEVKEFANAHDRFLCIDDVVYHFGASIKDLGKKWFGFNRMEQTTEMLLARM